MPLAFLLQAGLTPTQAEILGFLLSQEELKAKEIVRALNRPRGVIYKGLLELTSLELVKKIDRPGQVAKFSAEHPEKLQKLFETKEALLKQEHRNFLAALPDLSSKYNTSHLKPHIRLKEGEVGTQEILEEALGSSTDLLLFIDASNLTTENVWESLISKYDLKRRQTTIKLKVIIATDQQAIFDNLKGKQETSIEIHTIRAGAVPFKTSLLIFNNKICYQTFELKRIINITIEDNNIYSMNKAMFDYLWQTSN